MSSRIDQTAKIGRIGSSLQKAQVDDLSDLDKYSTLKVNVERALLDMQNHYRELAFSKIFTNKESIYKIDNAMLIFLSISNKLRRYMNKNGVS